MYLFVPECHTNVVRPAQGRPAIILNEPTSYNYVLPICTLLFRFQSSHTGRQDLTGNPSTAPHPHHAHRDPDPWAYRTPLPWSRNPGPPTDEDGALGFPPDHRYPIGYCDSFGPLYDDVTEMDLLHLMGESCYPDEVDPRMLFAPESLDSAYGPVREPVHGCLSAWSRHFNDCCVTVGGSERCVEDMTSQCPIQCVPHPPPGAAPRDSPSASYRRRRLEKFNPGRL